MSWRSNVVIAAAVLGLGVGALNAVDPLKDPSSKAQQEQQQVGDASDNQEKVNEQLREDGNKLGDTTYRDKLGHHFPRPRIPLP